ncbi:hypothetical protein K501DRAFT_289017 [Backusella circina FSU 941]|nr:hypothetical protein K501DRAFT_289017 [Backusella circina FSU 941]
MSNKNEFTSVYMTEPEPAMSRTSSEPLYIHGKANYTDPSLDTNATTIDGQQHIEYAQPEEPKPKRTIRERIANFWYHSKSFLTVMFIDVALPLIIYYVLKNFVSILIALILSGIPPLLLVIYHFIKHRRLDIMGCIFVISYIVSAVLSVVTADVRLTLLRDSSTTALMSFMFLLTMIPFSFRTFRNRPLVYLLTKEMYATAEDVEWIDAHGDKMVMKRIEWIWEYYRPFRKFCYIITGLWGFFLMGEFIAKVVMIESTLDIDHILLYGNIILSTVLIGMTIATSIASRNLRKGIEPFAIEWRKQHDFSDTLPK